MAQIALEVDNAGNLKDFATPTAQYRVIPLGSPLGINRYTAWRKLCAGFGVGQTPTDIIEGFRKIQLLILDDKKLAEVRRDIVLLTDSYIKGVVEMTRRRFDQAFWVCSCFIYREGDDPNQWDDKKAERDIADWADSGVDENVLFFFAANKTSGMRQLFNDVTGSLLTPEADS
jgi:hypothetical protein